MNSGNLQQQDVNAALARAESLFGEQRFEDAAAVYIQVLSTLEMIHGPTSPELAYPLQKLGDSFHVLNRFRDSLPVYQRLLSIGHQVLGSNHPDMLNLMVKIARTQESIGSYQDSRRTYETVLSTMESSLGPGHEMVMRTRQGYEGLLARIEDNRRAAQAWKESTPAPQGDLPSDNSLGVPVPGMAAPGMPVPGMPVPGVPVPGMPAPGVPVPGMPVPGAPGMTVPAPVPVPEGPFPGVSGPGMPSPGGPSPTNGSNQPWGPPQPQVPSQPQPPAPPSQPLPSFPPRQEDVPPWGPPQPGGVNESGVISTQPSPVMPQQYMPPQDMPHQQMPPGQPGFPGAPGEAGFRNESDMGMIPNQTGVENVQDPYPQPPPPPPQPQPSYPPGAPDFAPQAEQVPSFMPPVPPPKTPSMASQEGIFEGEGQPSWMPPVPAPKNPQPPVPPRRNDPSNDPYLDHLASKVNDFHSQQGTGPQSPIHNIFAQRQDGPGGPVPGQDDSGWHDGGTIPVARQESFESGSQRSVRKGGQPIAEDGYQDGFEEEYDDQESSTVLALREISASRDVVSKSDGMVSAIRSVKEFLIPTLVLVFLIGGGVFLYMSNPIKAPEFVKPAVVAEDVALGPSEIYMTPCGSMRVSIGSSGRCVINDDNLGMHLPYMVYDSSVTAMALQWIDSVMERQFWFVEIPEGLRSESGVVLYKMDSPDAKVLMTARDLYQKIGNFYLGTGSFPSELVKNSESQFKYLNPFTNAQEDLKIYSVRYEVFKDKPVREFLMTDGLIAGEKPPTRGQIVAYAMLKLDPDHKFTTTAFYMRAANRNGQFFQTRKGGEVLLFGWNGREAAGNDKPMNTDSRVYVPHKSTKVWLARNQFLPIFFIHFSVPIVLAMAAGLLFWRSLMVRPGQNKNNPVNKSFRLASYVFMIITAFVVGAQYFLWR